MRRLRPQLVEDRSQRPNAIGEGVLGSTDELHQLDGQDGLFFVGQVKVRHNPDMGWRSTNVPAQCSVADAMANPDYGNGRASPVCEDRKSPAGRER